MPEWMTPLLWPVWWRPTSVSFSTTTSSQPGSSSSNDTAVARPTMPPPITQKSYTRPSSRLHGRRRPMMQHRCRRAVASDVTRSMASTRPQSSAVGASTAVPVNPSSAVRWRPIRRGRLTVPPAPGTRPRDSSGRAKRVSGWATTRPAKAGSSTPAPMHEPWARTSTRDDRRATRRAGLRVRRIRCDDAGSGKSPNSSRSPPLQNDGPAPRSTIRSIESSTRATRQRFGHAVAHRPVEGVVDVGPVERDGERAVDPVGQHGVRPARGAGAAARPARQRANSGPPCSME